MACSLRRARAFTMIELMFVIVIIGIMLVVAVPRMSGTGSRTALEATGRDMARLGEFARQSAIARQKNTAIVFDAGENTWQMTLDPKEDETRIKKTRRHEAVNEFEEPRELDRRVSFKEFLRNGETVAATEPVRVMFYPNGSSTGLSILLANDKGRVMTLEIERATGRSSAYAGEPMTLTEKMKGRNSDKTPSGANDPKLGKDRFYQSAGSSEERVQFYEDAASRIMGQVTAKYERQQSDEDLDRMDRNRSKTEGGADK